MSAAVNAPTPTVAQLKSIRDAVNEWRQVLMRGKGHDTLDARGMDLYVLGENVRGRLAVALQASGYDPNAMVALPPGKAGILHDTLARVWRVCKPVWEPVEQEDRDLEEVPVLPPGWADTAEHVRGDRRVGPVVEQPVEAPIGPVQQRADGGIDVAAELDRIIGDLQWLADYPVDKPVGTESPAVAYCRHTPAPIRMAWREVAERMKRLRAQGDAWTSHSELAKRFGCSAATIHKAIEQTPELHAWARRQRTPRAQSVNAVVNERAEQRTELDPADDAAIREYIETADPTEKAWFLNLATADQLAFLNDPESHHRLLGRRA